MEKDERLLPLPQGLDLRPASNRETPTNYAPFYGYDTINEGRSLREYLMVVYKRLPLILAFTILITALAAFYMYRLPSVYEAQTGMVIEPPKPVYRDKGGGTYINFGYDTNYYNTQLKLLKSADLIQDVVIQLGLYREPNLFNQNSKGLISSIRSIFSGAKQQENKEASLPNLGDISTEDATNSQTKLTLDEQQRAESYASTLMGNLTVDQVQNTNLVNIKIQTTNPEIAAKVTDTIADVFIKKDAERVTKGAQDSLQELSKSIDDLRTSIDQQELERINALQANALPIGKDEKGGSLTADRLRALSSELLVAQNELGKIKASYEQALKANNPFAIQDINDNPVIQNIRTANAEEEKRQQARITDLTKEIDIKTKELTALRVKYTDEHREVKGKIAEITELKVQQSRLQKEVDRIVSENDNKLKTSAVKDVLGLMQSKYAAAQQRVSRLSAEYSSELRIANSQGLAETKLISLSNEIDTNRTLLNKYLQEQKEMDLAIKGSKPENITVSNRAFRPTSPIGPQRNRNIVIAFLLSLATGIGLAFLLDYLDDSLKNSDDVSKYLGLPTLALIPHQSLLEKKKRGMIPAKTGEEVAASTALISVEDTRSAMAEAYRHLRTSLLFSSAGKPPQSILVTSSQPSEGKTTTAMNTAITLAQAGADVVIIDCDLRRPRLHSHFAIDNTTGLTNYLSGDKNAESVLKQYPDLPKLKIITSGPIPPNPAELLGSNEMSNLLKYLQKNFQHVIVDSPPAISFTDAAILSTQVDGVIIVAMSGKSSIQLIRRFKQRMNAIGARIYGVVLNGIKPDSFEYGYYGYGYEYTYDYYYTPEDDDSTPRMEDSRKTAAKAGKT